MVATTRLSGAAATTAALAALGPGGMVGGLAILTGSGVVAWAVARWGVEKLVSQVLEKLHEEGELMDSILERIEGYPLSRHRKDALSGALVRFAAATDAGRQMTGEADEE